MLILLARIAQGQVLAGALDEALLARIAQGDTGALEELYRQSSAAVYGFALSVLRNPQMAEDVMQDTYVRIYEAAGTYRPQGKPMAWILTIVRNLSRMKLRAAKNSTATLADYDPADDAGDFEQRSLARLVLQTALAHLSLEERQIVVLHSISGLRHREIAGLMGLPLSTVLSKYRRALKKLRILIGEEAGL